MKGAHDVTLYLWMPNIEDFGFCFRMNIGYHICQVMLSQFLPAPIPKFLQNKFRRLYCWVKTPKWIHIFDPCMHINRNKTNIWRRKQGTKYSHVCNLEGYNKFKKISIKLKIILDHAQIMWRVHDSNVSRVHSQPKHQNHDLRGWIQVTPPESSQTMYHLPAHFWNLHILHHIN